MSKNVAVFVDVANIFYAAKAAGVDIDYVTLLKSSIAGRDFVRAYAYTGLDPDNENQRQFHSFLARNGYKVVSKDIRKYGDGRIKANLDIELVVDLMRMARNLDIAVVVSGDGDFAPAIRAVQQMGVRVEVVSFRGNTSSDLIEVADAFTDIAQIARVEKGSARSGRRVAAEGDLSMTEVPEKETEGAPRRRRGRGRTSEPETPEVVAASGDASAMPANLIVLPGERLSRAPEDGAADEAEETDEAEEATAEEQAAGEGGLDGAGESADGRRRRRRRGGRGRGRGRREDAEVALEGGQADMEEQEEEDFEPLPPAQLPHQTFGSVWDTQLGVPSAPLTVSGDVYSADDEEYDDEPEVPEYLLAERRQRGQQRGQRGRMGRGGRGAGYQAAVERERFGRGGGGFGSPRMPDRQRSDRQRQGRQQRPQRQEQRPPRERERDRDREPRGGERPAQVSAGGQPWSEVPPEVEELLRAELARQAPVRRPESRAPVEVVQPAEPVAAGSSADAPAADALSNGEAPAAEAPKRRATTRRRTTAAAATAEEAPAEAAPKRRTTRRRSATSDEQPAAAADSGSAPASPAEAAADEPAAKPKRATRSRKTPTPDPDAAQGGEGAAATASAEADNAPAKPARRRRTKADATVEGAEAPAGEA